MKRYSNLYNNMCNLDNIMYVYDKVCRSIKNEKKRALLRDYKTIYVKRIYETLIEKKYVVGKYNKFKIYDPKEREIYSQNIEDKVINHLVAKYILYPSLLPCLIHENVASRRHRGCRLGLSLAFSYHKKCKLQYGTYYILKCDITKFFSSINHDILKQKLLKRIKDKDAIKILFDIIDSNHLGLYIGSLTSQILAIFYLNDLDHFIKERLGIKYYVRYQDDFLLFHKSKNYLKYCLNQITLFLKDEDLTLNSKTRLYKSTNNFIFLGRNNLGNYAKYRTMKRRIKDKCFHYLQGHISLFSFSTSIICFKHVSRKAIYP